MRGQYGTEIKVGNDIEKRLRVADVVVTVDGGEKAFLTPTQARELAKKLEKHARKVELANTVAQAREPEGGYL
jgi:hypothetical protein